jgi:hypothetical protein
LKAQCDGSGPANDLAFQLSEKAVFGGMILQRSFRKNKTIPIVVSAANGSTDQTIEDCLIEQKSQK